MKLLKYLLWFLLILLVVGFLTGLWFFKLRSKERVYTEKLTLTTKLDAGQTTDYNERLV